MLTGRSPRTGEPLRIGYAGGRITAIEPGRDDETAYVSAGLIDLQVNGYAGHDLNGGGLTVATVAALAAEMRRCGVTIFLPTLVTASAEAIAEALAVIAQARADDARLAHMMPFVHLEGPWIAPEDGPRGAHPREYVRPPDLAQFDRWQAASGNLIGLVTLSPHHADLGEVIAALVARGVLVAIGHTGASAEQIHDAAAAGARLSTHLGNGAAASLPRHPNFIWAQLADDRLMATFITDGHHLPADTFRAMLRAKGFERAIIVSDVVAAGGRAPGLYDQPVGGRVELSADGRLSLAGTPYLAGAALPLSATVARAIELGGITLADALDMATLNPGRLLGGRGRLAVGAPADLIRFNWSPGATALDIERVIVAGETQ